MQGSNKCRINDVTCIVYLFFSDVTYSVATQDYVTETHNVYVILGNSALLKCQIPSFVADFVAVESWSDDQVAISPSSLSVAKLDRLKNVLSFTML